MAVEGTDEEQIVTVDGSFPLLFRGVSRGIFDVLVVIKNYVIPE